MGKQRRIVGILFVILMIALVAAAALLWLLPGAPAPEDELEIVSDAPLFIDETVPTTPAQFNVSVFEQAAYRALNLQFISDGSLPVQPPANAGKANPFL